MYIIITELDIKNIKFCFSGTISPYLSLFFACCLLERGREDCIVNRAFDTIHLQAYQHLSQCKVMSKSSALRQGICKGTLLEASHKYGKRKNLEDTQLTIHSLSVNIHYNRRKSETVLSHIVFCSVPILLCLLFKAVVVFTNMCLF